jgi:hypothetical protein
MKNSERLIAYDMQKDEQMQELKAIAKSDEVAA